MKNVFRAPGEDERALQFQGCRLNSDFRISLLNSCGYRDVSLAKAAELAGVDYETLKLFIDGQDGTLDYSEMERLIKAVNPSISRIMIITEIENLDCNGPAADEIPDDMKQHYKRHLDWSWEDYSERGTEQDEKPSRK